MATGHLPFERSNINELVVAQVREQPPRPTSLNPSIPPILEAVILRCLEKDPADRFPSARDLFNHARMAYKTPTSPVPTVEPGEARTMGGRVLLVDPDQKARHRLRSMLEPLGVTVWEAQDGQEAAQRVFDIHPDLVIMEVEVPVMDGRDVLRVLKSNAKTREVPVVMLTSIDDDEEGWLLRDMGAAAFLCKPIQTDVMELLVDKFVH
jgi:CheY-like chemotaxis protein